MEGLGKDGVAEEEVLGEAEGLGGEVLSVHEVGDFDAELWLLVRNVKRGRGRGGTARLWV